MLKVKSSVDFKSEKILTLESAKKKIEDLRKENKKTGMCHGSFDLLHPGHIKHFESSKKLCDYLLVSVTSDKFVSLRKGAGRPIFNENLRAYMIASLFVVDFVVITDFLKGTEPIKILRPSFYIKGSDYIDMKDPVLKEEILAIESTGGKILMTKDIKFSTTNIIMYIKEKVV